MRKLPFSIVDFKRAFLFWVILGVSFSVLYQRLIVNDPRVGPDDTQLIAPLEDLTSVSDYVRGVRSGRIYDVQPVRDFSLWLDIQAKRRVPFASFHLTNSLIWLVTVILVFRTLLSLKFRGGVVYAATALVAIHPVFMNSVAWIAARKHLLSTLFIVAATHLTILTTRDGESKGPRLPVVGLILALYFLACFSQPINILWPIFAIVYLTGHGVPLLRSHRGMLLVLGFLIIGAACAYLNQRYYTGIYVAQSGGSGKYVTQEHNDLGIRLLAFGRYFLQTVFPVWPCVSDAYPGSPRNVIGLMLFPVFAFFVGKHGGREARYWLLYFILPLVPVLLRMTNVFSSDTYVLNAGIGVLVASVSICENRIRVSPAASRVLASVAVVAAPFFFVKSYELSRAWESSLTLWEHSYRTEATPLNTTKYALNLLEAGKDEEALDLALRVREWKPHQPDLPVLFAKAVYRHPSWSTEKKIAALEGNRMQSPWYSYFLAGLYASSGNFERAFSEMRTSMENLERFAFLIADELEIVTAESYFFCVRSNKPNCGSMVLQIKNEIRRHPFVHVKSWNDAQFTARLEKLGLRWLPDR